MKHNRQVLKREAVKYLENRWSARQNRQNYNKSATMPCKAKTFLDYVEFSTDQDDSVKHKQQSFTKRSVLEFQT